MRPLSTAGLESICEIQDRGVETEWGVSLAGRDFAPHEPMSHRVPGYGLLLAAGAAWCGVASAQSGISGSQSQVLFATSVGGGFQSAQSANYQSLGSLGAPAELAAGVEWSLRPATVWTGTSFAPAGPLVFSTFPAHADRAGGVSASVIGFGFTALGAGPLTVALLGQSTPASVIASNSLALFNVPAGVGALGNPLGRGDIVVQNQLGSASAADAFTYTPAVVAEGPLCLGQPAPIAFLLPPASFYALAVGGSIPGVGLPVPPLQGSLELLSPVILVSGLKFTVAGAATFPAPIQNDPGLIGVQFELQALSLINLDPLGGTFTNRLVVTIES